MIISKIDITEKEKALFSLIMDSYNKEAHAFVSKFQEEKNDTDKSMLEIAEELADKWIEEERNLTPSSILKHDLINKQRTDKEKELTLILGAFLDDILDLDIEEIKELPQWSNFSIDELSILYYSLAQRIGERYLQKINYSSSQFIYDLHETLRAYTVTDLEKAYRVRNKTLITTMCGLTHPTDTEEGRYLVHYLCIDNLLLFFKEGLRAIELRAFDHISGKYNSNVYMLITGHKSPYSVYDASENKFIELDKDKELNEGYRALLPGFTDDKIEEFKALDHKLFDISFEYFKELYTKLLEKKERDKARQYKYRHKDELQQISIFDIEASLETVKDDFLQLKDKEKPLGGVPFYENELTQGIAKINHKDKKKMLNSDFIPVIIYENDKVKLTAQEKNNILAQLTKDSIPTWFFFCTCLIQQTGEDYNKDKRAKVVLSTSDVVRNVYNKDPNNPKDVRYVLEKIRKETGILQLILVEMVNNKNGAFTRTVLISEVKANPRYISVEFPQSMAEGLLTGSHQALTLPLTVFSLGSQEVQITFYIYWQGQMYKNHIDDNTPIRLLPNGNIEVKRAVKSVLGYATSFNSEKIYNEDKEHYLGRVARPFEDKLTSLTETPANWNTENPKIIQHWRYEGDTDEKRRSVFDSKSFNSVDEWLNTQLIIEIPAVIDFDTNLNKHIEEKEEKKRLSYKRGRKPKKTES